MKRFSIPLVLVLALLSLTAGDVIDRIAAVVNDDVILLSEVEEKMFILQAQGQLQGQDSTQVAQARREILDRLIEERLVVQRARSQSIEADPQEVTNRVNDAMTKVKERFPSLEAFRQALAQEGISENMLRERYHTDITQEFLGQRIVGKEVRSKVQVTSDDVEHYFKENKDELPRKPMEVQLAHLLVYPVSPAKENAAKKRIENARARIEGGEDFAAVAREVSDDPTKTKGGELGWFSPGDLDPDFESAVDSLAVNAVSEPVRTRFGYHLIQVEERDGDRYRVRHILALVDASQEDLDRARARADSALEKLQGGAPWDSVVRRMSDDALTRDQGGDLGWTPTKFLVPAVATAVESLEVGSVSQVVPSDRGFHIFKVENRRTGEDYTFDEIKDQLRTYLEQKKLEEAYDTWMAGIRDSAYVEIKAWDR